jgi:hypothetical protein
MSHPAWESYVARLCLDKWALDPASLIKVMADIEALIAGGEFTDSSVATVLRMAGVIQSEVDSFAPRICDMMRSTLGRRGAGFP